MYRYTHYPYNIAETFLSKKKYLDFFADDKLNPHHFYIDENFKITSCCEHLSERLSYDNYPVDELFGLDSRLLFESDTYIVNALSGLRFRPNDQKENELKLKRKDGTEFWAFMLFRYEDHMISGQRTLLCQYININQYKQQEKKRIFLCYSRADEELKKQLDKHLSILKKSGKITTWNDEHIIPGEKWDKKIKQKLHEADIVLCLISVDFLASEYIMDIEIPLMLKNEKEGKTKVVPVVLRKCDWCNTELSEFQSLPKSNIPITSQTNIDEALHEVCEGIKQFLD